MEKVPPIKEVVDALFTLPKEQIATVYEFIMFLQARYGQEVDIAEEWTDEDVEDLRTASLQYISASLLSDEGDND